MRRTRSATKGTGVLEGEEQKEESNREEKEGRLGGVPLALHSLVRKTQPEP